MYTYVYFLGEVSLLKLGRFNKQVLYAPYGIIGKIKKKKFSCRYVCLSKQTKDFGCAFVYRIRQKNLHFYIFFLYYFSILIFHFSIDCISYFKVNFMSVLLSLVILIFRQRGVTTKKSPLESRPKLKVAALKVT